MGNAGFASMIMPPDYRIALTEAGIWLRKSIPRHRLHRLIAAAVDLRTSFQISGAMGQDAEMDKLRAMGNIRDMYFDEKTTS
jgi:hypothetical protein